MPLSEVDEQAVAAFSAAQRRKGKSHRCLLAALRRIVARLRTEGVVPEFAKSVSAPTPVDGLLGRFEAYLRTERALLETTVVGYRPFARCFLGDHFGAKGLLLRELRPADVSKFLLRQVQSLSRVRAKLLVTALRAFFRFLLWSGEIDMDLSACVLSVPDRKLSTVPKYLGAEVRGGDVIEGSEALPGRDT